MNLTKLYKMQEELDQHIIENNNIKMSKEELLDNTILALLVEVGELANTTRCFKHWSTKGMMGKEIILDEFADCLHFYLSIGNQLNITSDIKHLNAYSLNKAFIAIYEEISKINAYESDYKKQYNYDRVGHFLFSLAYILNFRDEEVEQAYLKKHEENYKRQREGY